MQAVFARRTGDKAMSKANTATAADFDASAQAHANSFWVWAAILGLCWWFSLGWWVSLPAAMAILAIVRSVGCTRAADKLREGTFAIPNPNNGAPDGDAANWTTALDYET